MDKISASFNGIMKHGEKPGRVCSNNKPNRAQTKGKIETNWRMNHKPSPVNGSPEIFTSPSQVKC